MFNAWVAEWCACVRGVCACVCVHVLHKKGSGGVKQVIKN